MGGAASFGGYPIGTWYFATVYRQAPQAVAEARAVPIPYPGDLDVERTVFGRAYFSYIATGTVS